MTASARRRDVSPRCSSMRFSRGSTTATFPKLTVIENKMNVDEMVHVNSIRASRRHANITSSRSTVAPRWPTFPSDKVIGLSKINRMVRFFAQRPQVQERLNEQVLVALQTLLDTDDVAVRITATHYCVKARGVMDSNSRTTTTSLGGRFKTDPNSRQEFLLGIQQAV